MDNLEPEKRHENMAKIKGTDTDPEKRVRSALHKIGYRFRKNDKRLPGKPDAVFPHYHAVVFVNGCFWHFHEGCPKARIPRSNTEFWKAKLLRNRERDKREISALLSEGWRVAVVWECAITGKNRARKISDVSSRISLWLEEGFDESFVEFR
ncbi:MAG: DNA mismatch endonuclease Vsr [Treponema sp.]|jgi:DNA mismatch endonuclease (patch repair protein)|nr:DNA mismatch endonuclease Vsr [Treponema sp.]